MARRFLTTSSMIILFGFGLSLLVAETARPTFSDAVRSNDARSCTFIHASICLPDLR